MRRHHLMIRVTAVAAAVGAAASLAGTASAGFSGNVCHMLKAKQVLAVHVPATCHQKKTATTAQGTIRTAIWGKNSLGGPRLSVGVWQVTNKAFLAAMKAPQGKGSGKALKIGNWARETGLGNGGTADGITLVVGNYVVLIALNTDPKRPLKNSKPLIALAKAVAKQL